MNAAEAYKAFPWLTPGDINVNPLAVAETSAFNRPHPRKGKRDYRTTALDAVLKLRVGFDSTCNGAHQLFLKLFTIKCPYCASKMKCTGGGGATSGAVGGTTPRFSCPKCKSQVFISMPWDGIQVIPPAE